MVALYLTERAETLRPVTLTRRMAAISIAHQRHGYPSPTTEPRVREILKGIRRTHGTAQREAAPAVIGEIRRMVARLPEGTAGARDRALLLVGFAGALRASELVELDAADLEPSDRGLLLVLRRSKTDQEGRGDRVALPYGRETETCPVRALRGWLEVGGITDGPIFRPVDRHGRVGSGRLTTQAVSLVVKRAPRSRDSNPSATRLTACGRGSSPRRRRTGPPSGPSPPRPATSRWPSSVGTSGTPRSSPTTP